MEMVNNALKGADGKPQTGFFLRKRNWLATPVEC